eukprot:TRINITY_DN27311_c0_g1_i1.p2 TRINITY_DN27311_c0_g1~~TRINITY_DN27311_c0_g1_i1.p2  ORF type:complete len:132 (+),score=19.86 TRINITY_DN27311_c0_g1_i1:17-412(+)
MRLLIILVFALLCQPGTAQERPANGKIIFYRPGSVIGAAVACPIRHEGKEIVELGRNRFAEWTVPSGRYIFMNKTAGVEVTVMPGETRYVRCSIKTGFMSGRADLQISDRASFEAKAAEYQRKEIGSAAGE